MSPDKMLPLWIEVLNVIKDEISPVSFDTWIKSLEFFSFENDTLCLKAPDDFHRTIINSRYLALIQNAFRSIYKKNCTVSILVEEDDMYLKKPTDFTPKISDESFLNPKYTFESFVVGNSNRFAHAYSLAVAEFPAKKYNPLFIYGRAGLGKTHLSHAIGNFVKQNNPNSKVLYVSSEKFTNELINSIKDDRNEEFREKYRTIDLFIVDDIQFIAGKERTQEEFFHTFNSLYDSNKQIILTSDRPPKEIIPLEERLRSRFEWGLTCDIAPPDYETRIAILRKKAQNENVDFPPEVYVYIAENIKANIRELEGALNRIVAYTRLNSDNVTLDIAKEALKEVLSINGAPKITIHKIIDEVAKYFNITTSELVSKKRTKEVALARQTAMYLINNLIQDISLKKIGEKFGGKDHTTVLHALRKIEDDVKNSSFSLNMISDLIKNIEEA